MSEKEPALKRQRIAYDDVIQVIVGKDCEDQETTFTAHLEAIIASSTFFRSACSGSFKESQEKIVRLPEIEADVFKSYLHWVYSGQLAVSHSAGEVCDATMFNLIRLYAAAEMFGDIKIKNDIVDALLERFVKQGPSAQSIKMAWEKTPSKSPLQPIIIAWFLGTACHEWFEKNHEALPRRFIVDLVHRRMLNKNKETPVPKLPDKARYHEKEEAKNEEKK